MKSVSRVRAAGMGFQCEDVHVHRHAHAKGGAGEVSVWISQLAECCENVGSGRARTYREC